VQIFHVDAEFVRRPGKTHAGLLHDCAQDSALGVKHRCVVAASGVAGQFRSGLDDLLRQIFNFNPFPGTQHHGALQRILKLAQVAGPTVGPDRGAGLRRKTLHKARRVLRQPLQKVRCQKERIVASFAQRRQTEGNDIYAVRQIAPETGLPHQLGEIAIGRRRSTKQQWKDGLQFGHNGRARYTYKHHGFR